MTHAETRAPLLTPVLLAGSAILLLSFAVRSAFGLFQIPVAEEFGWARAEFSFAIALQNLAWGIGQPIFGAIAEKIGDRKAIIIGALLYSVGLILSSGPRCPGSTTSSDHRGLRHRGHRLRRDPRHRRPGVLGREPVDVARHRHRRGIGGQVVGPP
jgi:hypothetical protein